MGSRQPPVVPWETPGTEGAVAIVGAGCRFPGGVTDPRGLWHLLVSGGDAISEVPPSRWDLERYYDPEPGAPGAMYSRWGGFIEDETRFDAGFFGIARHEARQMDPRQRMLLEVCWEALENAGIVPGELSGTRTSVLMGSLGADYFLLHAQQAGIRGIDPWYASGKEQSFTSGRLSYLLGLNGPSLSISTACSSSLVAVHLARQSLLTGESDYALAGGVSLVLSPELSVYMCQIGALSKDGRCKVFDASADGIVRSDGCAVLVLRRLADALADGDDILAVVRGTAVNHDGHSAGLTVPNGGAQESLLRDALRTAGLGPHQVGYVEAHGTGTPLGDPIEMGALAKVYGAGRAAGDPLLVGSVKTNIGHTDAAAGAAGLLKAALAVRHGEVPPHLHLGRPNPMIRWDRWGVSVPTERTPFPVGPDESARRVAGVSAFGLSGTNAHVLVEQPPPPRPAERPESARPTLLLPLSARSGGALRALAEAHRERLDALAAPGALAEEAAPATELSAYVRTAAERRTHHREQRLAVAGRTAAELSAELGAFLERNPETELDADVLDPDAEAPAGPCFVFSGQGGQWPGMARELAEEPGAFAETLRRCDALVRDAAGWSVLTELTRDEEHSRLADTAIAQPVIFAVQVASAALWRSWGVRPAAVLGHSMGEIAAAQVAGALDLADAVNVVVRRGRLLAEAAGAGGMASVALGAGEAEELLAGYDDRLSVAAVNSPSSVAVSGDADALAEFTATLTARDVNWRAIPGGYAFHSPRMEPFRRRLTRQLRGLPWRAPDVPVFVTTRPEGANAAEPRFDAAHWGRNVRRPVAFAEAVAEALAAGHRTFVELGPHPALAQPLHQCLGAADAEGTVLPTLRRGADGALTARVSLAALYRLGHAPAWETASGGRGRSHRLPTYPWQGERLWFETAAEAGAPGGVGPADPSSADPSSAEPSSAVAHGAHGAPAAPPAVATVPAVGQLSAELRLFDAEGRLVAETSGLRLSTPGAAAPPTAPTAPASAAAPATDVPAPPDADALADRVAEAVAGVLGRPNGRSLRRRQGFTELGMDSLGAVRLCDVLRRELGVRVPRTAAFDHPTVERMAEFLATLLPARPSRPAQPEPVARPLAEAAAPAPAAGPATPATPATPPAEPIAVIGIGCRFPGGAHGPDGYWRLLREGVDAVRAAPEGRLDGPEIWRGGFLDQDVSHFDAGFFRVPPREARSLDPQHRLFLEVAWEALEDAGQRANALAGSRTGVFVGINSQDYNQLVTGHPDNLDASYGTGVSFCAAPGRLSYLLGLRGPSLAVDTACSSSLVAVHLAVASLRSGESEMAIAAGVNLMLRSTIHATSAAAGALSTAGRCATFDASADGYIRGEGCGAVVLKPLSRARADGDEVLAVVLGSAVNQDGPSGGLTVPNGPAQTELVRAALADARVSPGDIGYVEAHGTGTPLGDPIELRALGEALGRDETGEPCVVGSVKTNIGHLEAASGVAGLIKTVLTLRHGEIPRHLHHAEPSPDIPWERLPFRVPTEPLAWPAGERPRYAGVSAFGLSGTNAHVVLGEAPADATSAGAFPRTPAVPADAAADPVDTAADPVPVDAAADPVPAAPAAPRPPVGTLLLPLSAASRAALVDRAAALRDLLTAAGAPAAVDVCHTAALRRGALDHRLVVTGRDAAELAARLDAFVTDPEATPKAGTSVGQVAGERRRGPVFVFSGHGSQWVGMARDLLAEDPVFAAAVARCDEALSFHLDWSVRETLAAGSPVTDAPGAEADQQILLFAIQYGLVELWRAAGVEPAAVLGHSMGETSAALCAGALTLDQAAEVIARRSGLLRDLVGRGGMAVVGLGADETEAELAGFGDRLCVAVVNSRQSTVVSGTTEALEEFGARMRARKVFFRVANVGGPAHSSLVEPMRVALVDALAGLTPGSARVPVYSSVTGGPLGGGELTAEYWGRNLRQPVRFADAVTAAVADGHDTFVELSPHPLQLTPIEQEVAAAGGTPLTVHSLLRDTEGALAFATALGALHTGGQPVDWRRVLPRGRQVSLPRYPWQHRSYWVPNEPTRATPDGAADAAPGDHPLLGRARRLPGTGRARLARAALAPAALAGVGAAALPEHPDALAVPAALWLELALAAGSAEFGGRRRVRLADVRLADAHPVAAEAVTRAGVALNAAGGGAREFTATIESPWEPGLELTVATGRLAPAAGPRARRAERAHGPVPEPVAAWLAGLAGGESAPVAVSAATGDDAVEVALDRRPAARRWTLPPDLLELALRLPALLADTERGAGAGPALAPRWIGSLTVSGPVGEGRLLVGARRAPAPAGAGAHEVAADAWIATEDGTVVAELRQVLLGPPADVVLSATRRAALADRRFGLTWRERSAEDGAQRAEPGAEQAEPGAQRAKPGAEQAEDGAQRAEPGAERAEAAGSAGGEASEAGLAGAGARGRGEAGGADRRSWLLLADRGGVAAALGARLAARGEPHLLLGGGGRPATPEETAAALRALARGDGCRGVVQLAALDLPATAPDEAGIAELAALCGGLPALTALLDGVGKPPLWHVTRGAVAVDEDEQPAPLPAAVRRLTPVTGVGRPTVWGGALDLDPFSEGPEADAAELLADLLADDGEDQVAHRAGRRLVARAVRRPRPGPVRAGVRLRDDRTYVVAGAGDKLAGRLTAWLTERGAGQVLAVPAPQSRAEALRVLEKAAGGAPVGGVVWAAVDWELPLGASPDAGEQARALRERAWGAWLLDAACAEADLDIDLFVVFGSAASAWAAVGAEQQASVDGLLAALVERRLALGEPVHGIAWTPWDGVGMLDRESRARLVRGGLEPLDPAEAVDLLDQVVAGAPGSVLVADADLSLLLPLYRQALRWPLFDELADGGGRSPAGVDEVWARLGALAGEERRGLLLDLVMAEASAVLGLEHQDDLDPAGGFFELGVNSVTSLELRVRLERRFGVTLPATFVFEHPTCEAVAAYLERDLAPHLAPRPGGSPEDTPADGTANGAAPPPPPAGGRSTPGGSSTRREPPAVEEPPGAAPLGDDDLLARLNAETAAVRALIRGRG